MCTDDASTRYKFPDLNETAEEMKVLNLFPDQFCQQRRVAIALYHETLLLGTRRIVNVVRSRVKSRTTCFVK
jgi:hypothetical protein